MRIDRVVTSGLFTLAPEPIPVDNNVWILGDDERVIVIDAGHQLEPILTGIGGRTVDLIACTHGHNDHIDAAQALAEAVDAPIGLHPADRTLWDRIYPDRAPDVDLTDGTRWEVGSGTVTVLHTPGHSPGSVCLLAGGDLFGGDTLFNGGPGATQFEFGDHDAILESIETRLFVLPHGTVVRTGHGDSTTIGDEYIRMH